MTPDGRSVYQKYFWQNNLPGSQETRASLETVNSIPGPDNLSI